MSTWSDIQKLAADFQRIQLGESSKRLSDRNCVEVVSKLINDGLIDVVYTIDGKEYITRQHLITQIRNETLGCNGRAALTDIQQALNVAFHHVEEGANELIKSDPSFLLCVGQLITDSYLKSVCDEINDWLQESKILTIADITKFYDLPSDFLQEVISENLGKIIKGERDKNDYQILYTYAYIDSQKALINGALSGQIIPITINKVVQDFNLRQGLFFQCLDDLFNSKQLKGLLSGGRLADRAVYIPVIYRDQLAAWAENFFMQNGYLETATLKKYGWPEDMSKLGIQLENTVQLSGCVMSAELWQLALSGCSTALETNGWSEARTYLPAHVTDSNDGRRLLNELVKKRSAELTISGDSCVFSNAVLSKCLEILNPKLEEKTQSEGLELVKALRDAESFSANRSGKQSGLQQNESWDDSASNKKGSGKKSGKKGGGASSVSKGKRAKDDSDNDGSTVNANSMMSFMKNSEIVNYLRKNWQQDCPTCILEDIADKIKPSLNAKFKEKIENLFLSSDAASRNAFKHTHSQFEEKFRLLLQSLSLFDQSVTAHFNDNNTMQSQLRGFLLRTLCTDAVNFAFAYQCGLDEQQMAALTPKSREQSISTMPMAHRDIFLRWSKSLQDKDDLSSFFELAQQVCSANIAGVNIGKLPPDKKAKSDIVAAHLVELCRQIKESSDSAQVLLLALLISFTRQTASILHASGKFVPNLTEFLKTKLERELLELIVSVQILVVKKLQGKENVDENELSKKTDELKLKILNNSE